MLVRGRARGRIVGERRSRIPLEHHIAASMPARWATAGVGTEEVRVGFIRFSLERPNPPQAQLQAGAQRGSFHPQWVRADPASRYNFKLPHWYSEGGEAQELRCTRKALPFLSLIRRDKR